ncbi:hypothetical protein J18TS1_04310 [Oceanobacillus oncorhynchi subsp. incaldanensis]|uniref:Uncharacterized protein n=2 Tax=Oceanobacillus TaxID=182709 RepID=A0A0A1MW04_9BACI|nr:hypothetical protein [Oceanobacillus oncorhynchi]MDM8101877.1 hypothetical protein [Oceanobacillus oncorhynchi]UUI42095.1 hypothetical protein NP440_11465 [Oceanobacillus oncorhynchi]GIO17331.1 hypothetical protein J18TS1_04310 [Oceanobacillus oncorhynchi subsp. incaldanensis]CEI83622.1 hypothetical protein BN997_03539 [Oceanobacillus oncorhynchi]
MKRFVLLVFMLIVSIVTLFVTAYFQRDVNTLSLNDPQVIQASIIIMIILFIPPVLLSFFNHKFWRVISAIYQSIFFLGFIILVPTGVFSFQAVGISIVSLIGAVISLWSIFSTLPESFFKEY